MRDAHVIQMLSEPWAIMRSKLDAMQACARLHAAGVRLTAEEVKERIGAGPRPPPRVGVGDVAVIPIFGVISQRMSLMTDISGGTSCVAVAAALRAALADPSIKAIVLDVDSPGGSVFGVAELAAEILKARDVKPVVAVADSLMASAAYWIASAATEVVVTPGGLVGSIGVIAEHVDESAALEKDGVRVTLITAGAKKGHAHPSAPLSDDARASLQGRVDAYYGMFTGAVAKHRHVSAAAVRAGMGEGDVVGAADAVALGMADRIGTFDQVLAKLLGPKKARPAHDHGAIAESEIAVCAAAPAAGAAICVSPAAEDAAPAVAPEDDQGACCCPRCGAGCPDGATKCPACGTAMCCCPSCGTGCVADCMCCPACRAAMKCCSACGFGCTPEDEACPSCGASTGQGQAPPPHDDESHAVAAAEIDMRRRRLALISK